MPKVSVIIPTHNRAKLLPSAVKSVLQQTFQDFEIIIVDDASKDNTREVISQFDDSRIKYIGREISGGPSVAKNEGIINSHCEYIAFLDDDDEWFPEKLQRQIFIFEKSPQAVGVVYTGSVNVDGTNGKIISTKNGDKRGDLFHAFLSQFAITSSSVIVRKLCFKKVGMFDEAIFFGEDFDMWIRIAKDFQFECAEEPLTKYFIHQKKLSTNFDLVIKGKETVLEKHKECLKMHSKNFSGWYLELGILYALHGDTKKGRRAYRRSIELYPFRMKPYLIFILSCLGTTVFRKVTEKWNELLRTTFFINKKLSHGYVHILRKAWPSRANSSRNLG